MDREIQKFIKKYDIDLNNISIQTIKDGINVEMEHGTKAGLYMNVINDDIEQAFKIAMAHIDEFPDYYVRLKKLETEADEYWKTRPKKPNYSYYKLLDKLSKTWYAINSQLIIENDNVTYIEKDISYSGKIYVEDNKILMIHIKFEDYEIISVNEKILELKSGNKRLIFTS